MQRSGGNRFTPGNKNFHRGESEREKEKRKSWAIFRLLEDTEREGAARRWGPLEEKEIENYQPGLPLRLYPQNWEVLCLFLGMPKGIILSHMGSHERREGWSHVQCDPVIGSTVLSNANKLFITYVSNDWGLPNVDLIICGKIGPQCMTLPQCTKNSPKATFNKGKEGRGDPDKLAVHEYYQTSWQSHIFASLFLLC